tara:strand:+ start:114 stop:248 length:135 start_codon:yes stop_codon:yes gene_type:complete
MGSSISSLHSCGKEFLVMILLKIQSHFADFGLVLFFPVFTGFPE